MAVVESREEKKKRSAIAVTAATKSRIGDLADLGFGFGALWNAIDMVTEEPRRRGLKTVFSVLPLPLLSSVEGD